MGDLRKDRLRVLEDGAVTIRDRDAMTQERIPLEGVKRAILDRLATYQEKILAIKGKIKSALFYPVSIIVVALVLMLRLSGNRTLVTDSFGGKKYNQPNGPRYDYTLDISRFADEAANADRLASCGNWPLGPMAETPGDRHARGEAQRKRGDMRTIVCGVDGSPGARAALRVAARLAEELGARLVAVHVLDRLADVGPTAERVAASLLYDEAPDARAEAPARVVLEIAGPQRLSMTEVEKSRLCRLPELWLGALSAALEKAIS